MRSKRTLVPRIVALATAVTGAARRPGGAGETPTAGDLFCGITRAAQGLKAAGVRVTANDMASYGEVLAARLAPCVVHQGDQHSRGEN